MTPKEFIIWLKGFSKAANEYNITPKQWDAIVEELYQVKNEIDKDCTETNYVPWYNPYQPDYRTEFQNTSSNTATSLQFPKGTTINYTNSNKKQKLND